MKTAQQFIFAVALTISTMRLSFVDGSLVSELEDLTNRADKTVLSFDSKMYKRYLEGDDNQLSEERYGIVTLFTTMDPRHNCHGCHLFKEHLDAISKSYEHNDDSLPKLFFALLDYQKAQSVFEKYHIATVPHLVIFWSNLKAQSFLEQSMPMERYQMEAQGICRWIRDKTNVMIHLKSLEPKIQAFNLIRLAVFGILFFVAVYYFRNAFSYLPWAVLSVTAVLVFISGQMWNQIRNPPFDGGDGSKDIFEKYIARSSSYQLLAETYLVFGSYLLGIVGLILLDKANRGEIISSGKKRKSSKKRKSEFMWAGVVLTMVGINLISYFFFLKNRSYPYTLFH
ncbi:hypothetical protein ACOME3_002152 [Neoechinorhynchus agilis]